MIQVIVPSYNRHKQLVGKTYFHMAKYCIPESQYLQYKSELSADRLIVIPDEEDGSIVKKRNWILRNIPRPLIMIDDDVSKIVYTEGGLYFKNNGRAKQNIILPSELLWPWFEEGFMLAEGFETKMWGISVNTDGRNYQQYKPFSLTAIVLGPFQGHLEHSLYFDEAVGTKDDYDMCLQQMQAYKKVLKLNKFAYDCKHGVNQGGIVGMRTMEAEIKYCNAIMNKWGRNVIKYKIPPRTMKDLLNAQHVNIPIKGV